MARVTGLVKLFIFPVLFALAQASAAAELHCELSLVGNLRLEVHIDVQVDPHTGQPISYSIRPGPNSHAAPAPEPAPVYRRPEPAPRQVHPRVHREIQRYQSTSLGHLFHNMAHRWQLLQQTDYRLGNRGLLIPGGGLCASACAINVLAAVAEYQGGASDFTAMPDYKLHQMVEYANSRLGVDARTGLTMPDLAEAIRVIGARAGLSFKVDYFGTSSPTINSLEDLNLREDEIIIASIESGWKDGKATYHAIVITGVDPSRGIVSYSDPMDPNRPLKMSIRLVNGFHGFRSARVGYTTTHQPSNMTGVIQDFVRVRARN